MASERVVALKQELDELSLEWEPSTGEMTDEEEAVFEEAAANFRAAGPELLDEATPHLWAYYRKERGRSSAEEREEWEIPELDEADGADAIWDHVSLELAPMLTIGGEDAFEPAPSYLSFEGNVPWEPEHGLQLVFEHGLRLGKLGPCDGHNTNAYAYDDESLLGVVFVE